MSAVDEIKAMHDARKAVDGATEVLEAAHLRRAWLNKAREIYNEPMWARADRRETEFLTEAEDAHRTALAALARLKVTK